MGCSFPKASSCDCSNNNPKSNNFKILKTCNFIRHPESYCVLMINYPNCTNYEGNKILVYNYPLHIIERLNNIDPHFCENCISPIARFEPTEQGWDNAIDFIIMCVGDEY